MRIITGTARGKRLQIPEGLHTRPTAERVKESVFSIIQWDIEGRRMLDLFGGSGQIGLEALSRGAKSCVIVENDKSAQKIIETNIKNCGFGENCQLVKGDSIRFLSTQGRHSFDLIFLDPPYGVGLMEQALAEICRIDILSEGGIIICEVSEKEELPALPAPYRVLRRYHYSHTSVVTVTKGEAQ